MKDNEYLLSSPWIEAVQNLCLSSGALTTCIASYKNNYLKMHGKCKVRQIAGRKRKRKFHNQFSDNVRSEMRIYLKRKHKGIKHKKNRRNNEHQISI